MFDPDVVRNMCQGEGLSCVFNSGDEGAHNLMMTPGAVRVFLKLISLVFVELHHITPIAGIPSFSPGLETNTKLFIPHKKTPYLFKG